MANNPLDLEKNFNYISSNFLTKTGLISGWIFLGLIILTFNNLLADFFALNIRGWAYLSSLGAWLVYWLIRREKYPKRSSDKIHVVISIETEKNLGKSKILTDFLRQLNQVIMSKGLGNIIEVVVLNEYQSKVTSEILKKYSIELAEFDKNGKFPENSIQSKCKKHLSKIDGQFYIWGNILQRTDVVDKYFFELDGLVLHRNLTHDPHTKFTKEFVNSWFQKVSFETVQFSKLEVTTKLIMAATQYLIGLAAYISGDPETALSLHEQLLVEINSERPEKEDRQIKYIKSRIHNLVSEEAVLIGQWYISHQDTAKAKEYAAKANKVLPHNYPTLILQSVIAFASNQPEESLRFVKLARQIAIEPNNTVKDQAWRFNYAFLLMWTKQYGKAFIQYEKIIKHNFPSDRILLKEVYIWNNQLTDFIPSYFINGYLKYMKSKNSPDALSHLEQFVEKSSDLKELKFLRNIAIDCIKEIKEELRLKS